MNTVRFSRPPKALRRARLDNIALVPASLLPYKTQYQAVANQLPRGGVLVVIPSCAGHHPSTLATVVSGLRATGHTVVTLHANHFPEEACSVS
jgi:hypothetical protein